MSKGAPPSTNPSNLDSLIGVLRTSFTKTLQAMGGKLPAKVISYNRSTNRARVQPLIMVIDTQNNSTSRAPIASIPVFNYGGGGFFLSFNLQPGDLGWIQVNDRDISLFLQNYKEAKPNTYRIKDYGDSVFYPDIMTNYTIAGEDAENAVLQSADGTVKISLGSNKITINAPTVEIGSSATNVSITASGAVTVTAPTVNIDASTTHLGVGGQPIARKGDPVSVDPVTHLGTITNGGNNTSI